MYDIIKISSVFILIIILLRKKWSIGYVMLTASGALAVLYLMPLALTVSSIKNALTGTVTIKLALALTMIKSFELVLRENNMLVEMMNASKALLQRKKAVIISMPLLIGLLPSIGGAYFSAPMVDESTKDTQMSQEEKAFVNYWFRHPWEYILPLYPGILLASAITGIELRTIIIANTAYAVFIFITGFIFGMRGVKGKFPASEGISKRGALSFIPVAVILLLVVIFNFELHYALLIALAGLFIFYRYKIKDMIRVVLHGLSADVVLLIVGVMVFKEIMEVSGAVKNLSGFLTDAGTPLMPILLLLPFVSGLLTGLTVGFVGTTFPLILSIANGPSLGVITFAFAAGFMGVLFSPVHICLVLTREYFKADMWGVYKKIIPAGLIILCVAAVEYFLLR